jgi:hypothetical protein
MEKLKGCFKGQMTFAHPQSNLFLSPEFIYPGIPENFRGLFSPAY